MRWKWVFLISSFTSFIHKLITLNSNRIQSLYLTLCSHRERIVKFIIIVINFALHFTNSRVAYFVRVMSYRSFIFCFSRGNQIAVITSLKSTLQKHLLFRTKRTEITFYNGYRITYRARSAKDIFNKKKISLSIFCVKFLSYSTRLSVPINNGAEHRKSLWRYPILEKSLRWREGYFIRTRGNSIQRVIREGGGEGTWFIALVIRPVTSLQSGHTVIAITENGDDGRGGRRDAVYLINIVDVERKVKFIRRIFHRRCVVLYRVSGKWHVKPRRARKRINKARKSMRADGCRCDDENGGDDRGRGRRR